MQKVENDTAASINRNDPHVKNTQNLLQGTWISLDQKNVSVIFENNTRTENITGKEPGKSRYYQITDGCPSDVPGSELLAKSKAKYITLPEINKCYYIIKLDKDYMNLKVVGRNNIIRYKKEGSTARKSSKRDLQELRKQK